MGVLIGFLLEDYALSGYYPSYEDSVKLSLSYYSGSRYPFFAGCLKGFCLYAGTYSGSYSDSTFPLRDHVKVIDTISLKSSAVQEWAVLNRFFYSGNMLFTFEAGLVREVYSSVLGSKREIFPGNVLSLGVERKGLMFGGGAGYGRGDWKAYALVRYRKINRDSSISQGDTTGWGITVPEAPRSNVEVVLKGRWRGISLNLHRRDVWSVYIRSVGVLRGNLTYAVATGLVKGKPVLALGMGYHIPKFNLSLAGGVIHHAFPIWSVALAYKTR